MKVDITVRPCISDTRWPKQINPIKFRRIGQIILACATGPMLLIARRDKMNKMPLLQWRLFHLEFRGLFSGGYVERSCEGSEKAEWTLTKRRRGRLSFHRQSRAEQNCLKNKIKSLNSTFSVWWVCGLYCLLFLIQKGKLNLNLKETPYVSIV